MAGLQVYESRTNQSALDVALQFEGELNNLTEFLRANDVLNGDFRQTPRTYAVKRSTTALAKKTVDLFPTTSAVTVAEIYGEALITPQGESLFTPQGEILISPRQDPAA